TSDYFLTFVGSSIDPTSEIRHKMVASYLALLRATRLYQVGHTSCGRLVGLPKLRTANPISWTPFRMAATVTLEPAGRCCWDEPVRIAVRGLAPEQPVTLRASLRDEKGALFRAHARYCADTDGQLDLGRAPALGGSFVGLEPMGLFWALEPEKPLLRLVKRDVQTPFAVELEVFDGHEPEGGRLLGRAVHERDFLAPGVRREPVRAGRVRATLFLPPEPGPFPGIVDLFGAGGGLPEYRASLLAGKGFAVMALAYHNYEDLPKGIENVHLEYFEEAVNYLLSHPQVKGPGVGLLGISKGGELCLSMASFLKSITATVVINASVANIGGTLHYKGETLPPLGTNPSRIKATKDGVADILHVLNSPLEGPDQKSFIPVERAESAFLFLVGQDDHNWKSEFYANEASKRLQAHGKEKPQIICYPRAGHYIEPPYFPLCRASLHVLVGRPVIWGGEPRAHAMAQVDAWQQLQTFFHKHLGGEKGTIPTKL
uniref:ACOT2 thioesterase n=2 Tax=Sus scrofa TaxID=9823 RepID=A0A8D0Z4Y6_PIG